MTIPHSENQFFWDGDGQPITPQTLDDLLIWCTRQEASRVELQTNKPIMARIHGRNCRLSRETTYPDDLHCAVEHVYRSAKGLTHLTNGEPLDIAHTIWRNNDKDRYSYRMNILSSLVGAEDGISITIRPLADIPRPLSSQHVEQDILNALGAPSGIAFICGVTGSGKTTLIGGINRERLENPAIHANIIEGSSPIELLYDRVEAQNATMTQLEIGPKGNLPNYFEFLAACKRREPTDIVFQECRYPHEMDAAIQAAASGHRMLTSLHTSDVQSTMRSAIALCPADQRDSLAILLVENLSIIVNQRLLPSLDGKRTPIRSYLTFSPKFKNNLLDSPVSEWPKMTREELINTGQTFEMALHKAHQDGRISRDVLSQALDYELTHD
ncbi:ATPase, T2SS/T4P/T4SS family [Neokomagataea thailandica]|uniref:Twitching motility protein PilT n=1 Tax=Neokomagataea tanensis NBRC 106556 TaxID=1223519 RepID=A0ABQ0QKR9_9PROT|nr:MULTISPECIES: ATPase, T2SS/T4P/T4SS family [Neokomagataea]GBR48318.1 twitching motility protein PilT [Neokomagataea tanensis NBRC 106556]